MTMDRQLHQYSITPELQLINFFNFFVYNLNFTNVWGWEAQGTNYLNIFALATDIKPLSSTRLILATQEISFSIFLCIFNCIFL